MTDWDDEFANGAYIEGAAAYPEKWAKRAQAFRDELATTGRAKFDVPYGEAARERLDLFLPEGDPRGLAMFVHGGYWMAFDKSSWSHLARGAVESGWAMCLPSYTLAPDASLPEMTIQIAEAISFSADQIAGPICLSGHSAGGHLVARMVCDNSPLNADVQLRIENVVSISGLHDLRNLRHTKMNNTLHLNEEEAVAESAALQSAIAGGNVTCWVGGDERPEFIRQAQSLLFAWGADSVNLHLEKDRHHFDVIDDLEDLHSGLCAAFLGNSPRRS